MLPDGTLTMTELDKEQYESITEAGKAQEWQDALCEGDAYDWLHKCALKTMVLPRYESTNVILFVNILLLFGLLSLWEYYPTFPVLNYLNIWNGY